MIVNFKSPPGTPVCFSATNFFVLALQYRNFLSFNIYLYSILRRTFNSRPCLKFWNCIFLVKYLHIFNIIKKMVCHIFNNVSIFRTFSNSLSKSHFSKTNITFFVAAPNPELLKALERSNLNRINFYN